MGIEARENYDYDFKEELRELNKEVIKGGKETKNNEPELTYEEIKKFSDEDIKKLYRLIKNENEAFKASKVDKKGRYLKIKGKKIYYKDMAFMTQQSSNYNYDGVFLHVTQYEGAEIPQGMILGIKKGRKMEGIYIGEETKDKIYKGTLRNDTYGPIPAKK